ncbi:MAG: radical SAM protein [Planctomycetes bacterium]|nr:radical SAM protein [Planctomycetota bacterium]
MPSIILVNPPSLFGQPKTVSKTPYSYFEQMAKQCGGAEGLKTLPGEHLGLMSIKAYARREDIRVDVVNGQVGRHRSVEETWQEIKRSASDESPVLVGFSGTAQIFEENSWLARRCKEEWSSCSTIIGHDFATLNYRKILRDYPEFDFIALAEGEVTFTRLAQALLNGQDWHAIHALAWKSDGGQIGNNPLGQPLDLDALPWPDHDDLNAVLTMGLSASIFASRGCPYRCSYCTTGHTSALFGARNSHRQKSIENVIDEIAFMKQDYGVEHVTITDDLFVTKHPESRQKAEDFAKELIRRNIGIKFMIDCRVD